LEISATYYRQSILNLIHWQLGSFATWRPFNIDAELQGVEAELSWHLPGNIAIVKMSHNYADVRNRNGEANTDGKVLTYRPANSTKVGLEINFADLTVNYNRRMIGRRFVTEANTVSLPAYAIDDVRISYRKQISGFTTGIQFSVQNIFDTDYELIERGPMPGRTWGASLNIEY
jgi:outer membrane cobalamin receptor